MVSSKGRKFLESLDLAKHRDIFQIPANQVVQKAKNIHIYDNFTVYFTVTNDKKQTGLFRVVKSGNSGEVSVLLPYDNRKFVKVFNSDRTFIAETENVKTKKRGIFINKSFFIEEEYDEIVKDTKMRFSLRKGNYWGLIDLNWSNYPIPVKYDEVLFQSHSSHDYGGFVENKSFIPYLGFFIVKSNNKYGAYCYLSRRDLFGIYETPVEFDEVEPWNFACVNNKPLIFLKVKTEQGYNFYEVTEKRFLSDEFFDYVTDADTNLDNQSDKISNIGLNNLINNGFYGTKAGIDYIVVNGKPYKKAYSKKIIKE